MRTLHTACIGFIFILAVGTATMLAPGQTYVEQGRVLEANPRVGSGGLNTGARTYPMGSANRLISGNVTGGASFRGFSPIGDASSLFLTPRLPVSSSGTITGVSGLSGLPSGGYYGLPSDRLSSFSRDSFGIGDLERRRSLVNQPAPYYSPTGTVANTGAIAAGLNRPGTSQFKSPNAPPRPDFTLAPKDIMPSDASSLLGKSLNVQPRLMRVDNGQPVSGPVNTRLLFSPLFSGVRAMPVDAMAAQAERDRGGGVTALVDQRVQREGPLDTRVPSALLPPGVGSAGPNPTAGAAGGRPLDRVLGVTPTDGGRPAEGQAESFLARSLAEAPDVYTTMRSAAQVISSPAGAGVVPGATGLPTAGTPPERGLEERLALARRLVNEPVRTFAGTTESALNKRLAEAEKLMKEGQYYRSAGVYDFARALDPRSPLPLLGKTMALFAAGEYITAANNLFLAIQSSDAIGHFRLELPAFIPDINALDRRRADLESQLERFDDFRLRFLLGYVEYCSGLTDQGLANMKQAAQTVPEEQVAVKPFIETLESRIRGPLPPATMTPGK